MACCPTPSSVPAGETVSACRPAPSLAASAPTAAQVPAVHVHLHVPDLAGAVGFYRAFLGADPVKEKPGYAKFLPDWAPLNLALSQHVAVGAAPALGHLGLQDRKSVGQ